MTAPLNHPKHSVELKRTDIRSYYQSLSPNKSTIIRINTQSIESTDSQKPILHLNKTKTFIKSLNLENNLSVNGLKANSSDSIVVYRLSPDKSKDLLKRSVPSSHSSHSTQSSDTGSHRKRYLVSQRSGKVYQIVDKSQVSGVSAKREASEPDTDLICDDEFFKYLNLIGSKKLKTEMKSSLNQWSLRNISKVVPNPKYDHCGGVILTDVCPKPVSSEMDFNSNISEDKSEVSRRKLAKSQWLTEVRDNSNRLVNQREIDKFRDDMSRRRDKELKEWKTNVLNTISFFGLSSFMGKRIFVSLFCPLNQLQKYLKTCETEKYCFDSEVLKYMATINLSCNGVTRITRTRVGNDWNPRNYQHKYCFTRFQRLEKWKQLETGLNWRSRLLKSGCKRVFVQINRLNKCPICTKTIEFETRHQCYEFESHLRPPNSAFRSDAYDSSDEVVIIGDDFMSEDITDVKITDNKCFEVIKQNECQLFETKGDDEDDDIIIVEEVFKTKDSNVVIKSLLNISSNCSKRSSFETSKCLKSSSVNESQNSVSSDKSESNLEQNCLQQKDCHFVSYPFK